MTKEEKSSDFEKLEKGLKAGKIVVLKKGPNGEIQLDGVYANDSDIAADHCDEDSWMTRIVCVKGEYEPVFPANA
ncbi:MAG: hypothetical protein WC242_04270 [Candidatus Paceibacterota bacterium]